jgi:F-type H+-transporting ATPase subunit beta
LSPHDQAQFQRAKKLLNYMTQPFFTTESQTGKKGEQVERDDTIQDVDAIISGAVDHVPPEKFMYIGSLKEAGIQSDAVQTGQQPETPAEPQQVQ